MIREIDISAIEYEDVLFENLMHFERVLINAKKECNEEKIHSVEKEIRRIKKSLTELLT